jgi:hypothetical protein
MAYVILFLSGKVEAYRRCRPNSGAKPRRLTTVAQQAHTLLKFLQIGPISGSRSLIAFATVAFTRCQKLREVLIAVEYTRSDSKEANASVSTRPKQGNSRDA